MNKKKDSFISNIDHRVWLLISFVTAILIWVFIANSEGEKMIFPASTPFILVGSRLGL